MDKHAFEVRCDEYRRAVEEYLQEQFAEQAPWEDLYESMRYSLLAGGKRLRPILTLEFARLAGAEWKNALPTACALELVHTYSLIHDDLPCMDDDDLRRGKPTNHKVYGETLAVLAGDALQPAAYELILSADKLPVERRAECARILAEASGCRGMVAGQVLDTLHQPKAEAELRQVHSLKTGALIRAACEMGCVCGGTADALRAAARVYAENLGMAFQIRDDMLDVIGNADEFGKPIGSDREEGKVTFVDLLGLDGCERAVIACTETAKDAVKPYDRDEFLCALAESLVGRMK